MVDRFIFDDYLGFAMYNVDHLNIFRGSALIILIFDIHIVFLYMFHIFVSYHRESGR